MSVDKRATRRCDAQRAFACWPRNTQNVHMADAGRQQRRSRHAVSWQSVTMYMPSRRGGFMPNVKEADELLQNARPVIHQRGHDTLPCGHLAKLPIALEESTCKESVD